MYELRPYQQRVTDAVWSWFGSHPHGDLCVVAPTGSGKSVIIAHLIRQAEDAWPGTGVLVLAHQKELVEQDVRKILAVCPGLPIGIYSAGLRQKSVSAVTYASVQSICNHQHLLPPIDLCIVDEAHLINNEETGRYRKLLDALRLKQPHMRVIGLTATPYRLGQGMVTDGGIFTDIIEPVGIQELVDLGAICPLTSKATKTRLDVAGVATNGRGDYVEKDLQAAVDRPLTNEDVVKETIARAEGRHHWLVFCSGIDHAMHVRDLLEANGITADCVTGKTDRRNRDRILEEFKAGQFIALTNANLLTTGFDAPCVDLIVMLRPTMSPGLYVQMAGRGMRTAPGKKDCLVLDFAGNVAQHGPVTAVNPPAKKGKGGPPPCKVCPECDEIVPVQTKTCPRCGHEWPQEELDAINRRYVLDQQNDISDDDHWACIRWWQWDERTSKAGNRMLCVMYQSGGLSTFSLTECFLLWHDNPWVKRRAERQLEDICRHCGVDAGMCSDMDALVRALDAAPPPDKVRWARDGRYMRVEERVWDKKEDKNDTGTIDLTQKTGADDDERIWF